MEIAGKVVAVTGAARGIGRAICLTFAKAGASRVICMDQRSDEVSATARLINGLAYTVDVSSDVSLSSAIADVEDRVGPIDLFCSNAGVLEPGGLDTTEYEWANSWAVNVMAHVWAAKVLVPRMAARGGGYLLQTASAAGLLNQIGSVTYGVTKHAAIGLAEWIAMTHARDGIKVSVLCPQGVQTDMIKGHEDHIAAADGLLTAEDVAQTALEGVRDERFLILPHPQVADYMANKSSDYDRWIAGMARLHQRDDPNSA